MASLSQKIKSKRVKMAMYLCLGQDVVVKTREIVGIFDLDTSTVGKISRNYIYNAEKEKGTVSVSAGLPKSFVVCRGDSMRPRKVFISPLATSTLSKRLEMGSFS